MATMIVDSDRRAAFRLGHDGRLLRYACEVMCELSEPHSIGNLAGRIDDAAFVLLADDPPIYRHLQEMMGEVCEMYELQAELTNDGEIPAAGPDSGEPVWRVLMGKLDRMELLSRRAAHKDERLGPWFAVGWELADLISRLRARLADEAVAEPAWDSLIEAVGRLPYWDRRMIEDILDIRCDSLPILVECLQLAYQDISQHAAEPERDLRPVEVGPGARQDGIQTGRAEAGASEPSPKTAQNADALVEILGSLNKRLETLLTASRATDAATGGRGGRDSDAPEDLDDAVVATFEAMSQCYKDAFLQYQSAARELGEGCPKDKKAYDHVKSEGLDLVDFETWRRYLSEARKALGQSKSRPRQGRKGRSIVKRKEL